ncbi:MAG: T9SS type A sorting domain-containing protein, partial [Candidatus Kapaibacterium sp.]
GLGEPYPNPFTSHTTLPISLRSPARLTGAVYDLLGRELASVEGDLGIGSHSFDLDLSGVPAGVYLFHLSSEGKEIGSIRLNHSGSGTNGNVNLHILRGIGTPPAADKPAIPGTFSLVISHPNYKTATEENVTIEGKTVKFIMMTRIEFIPEFGTDENRTFTVIADARSGLDVPRDLEFNPMHPEQLWVVNRAFDGTVTYWNPGTAEMTSFRVRDQYANHFMEEVSAIAFSETEVFATSQESVNTYDGQLPGGNNFMGPALWTADTTIYSKEGLEDWGELGSHLDMLHASPNGMGIAHDHDNAYWYADGFGGNIVYYDFQKDHGPGHDDHSDGIIRRYIDARISRVPGVPGHMILDKASGWLYICDPGNRRVTRLNTKTGSYSGSGETFFPDYEQVSEFSTYTGATYEVFVNNNLRHPSGIALHNGRIFVTDNETGDIIAYDLTGKELNRISTNAQSIMGIEIGPDGKIWYVDAEANQVVRIDVKDVGD